MEMFSESLLNGTFAGTSKNGPARPGINSQPQANGGTALNLNPGQRFTTNNFRAYPTCTRTKNRQATEVGKWRGISKEEPG
jgi:hypothetical protein